MRVALTFLVLVLLAFPSLALAEEGAAPVVAPPMKASIDIGKALTSAQKIALLEEVVNKETDRRVEAEAKIEEMKAEIARMRAQQTALLREKTSAEGELGRIREALAHSQRDFETLRRGYGVVTKIIGFSYPVIAALFLIILGLLAWVLFIVRRLAVRVHDMPTFEHIRNYESNLEQLREQIAVEKNRTAALKERLSMLGVVD